MMGRCGHCGGALIVEPETDHLLRDRGQNLVCLACGRSPAPRPGLPPPLCPAGLHPMTQQNMGDAGRADSTVGVTARCRACYAGGRGRQGAARHYRERQPCVCPEPRELGKDGRCLPCRRAREA